MDESPAIERKGAPAPRADALLRAALECGLPYARAVASRSPALFPDAAPGAVLAAALPYPLGDPAPPRPPMDEPPLASLGSFARAHWYRTLADRLKALSVRLRGWGRASGVWKASDFRILVNSRASERPAARDAGLGEYGRNGLLIVDGAGSACVLGLLLLPFGIEDGAPPPGPRRLHRACASCRACVNACPTGAIGDDGGIDEKRCLQAWASKEGEVPPHIRERWGNLLYGCDVCLGACPLNARRSPAPEAAQDQPGFLGSGLSIPFILGSDPERLKRSLKGSALGLSWLSAGILKRNATLAAAAFSERETGR